MRLSTVDYHTAGEPFRIVVDGAPALPGATVAARRAFALSDPGVGRVRELLCNEPRGHADMYGGFLVPGDDDGADFGVLFWHKDGFSTACGHGSIALGVWAVSSGRVSAVADGETPVVIDVPSGRVVVRVRCAGGVPQSAVFRNVPARVVARAVPLAVAPTVPPGRVDVDLAFAGATYASVPAAALGMRVAPGDLGSLIAAARAIKAALRDHPVVRDPDGVYGVIFWEEVGDRHQRNVTVFADGEVDRSPCGSGTSARVALLWDEGRLPLGTAFTHDSIVGTRFTAAAVEEVAAGLVTEVEGMAYATGSHEFTLDPDDPLGSGFVLR